eukprot:6870438-Pyramimonas_sp.AAC.1
MGKYFRRLAETARKSAHGGTHFPTSSFRGSTCLVTKSLHCVRCFHIVPTVAIAALSARTQLKVQKALI